MKRGVHVARGWGVLGRCRCGVVARVCCGGVVCCEGGASVSRHPLQRKLCQNGETFVGPRKREGCTRRALSAVGAHYRPCSWRTDGTGGRCHPFLCHRGRHRRLRVLRPAVIARTAARWRCPQCLHWPYSKLLMHRGARHLGGAFRHCLRAPGALTPCLRFRSRS